jgi:uncharacterized protein YecE (DUF72 family)
LVEVQQTFYDPPALGTVQKWREEAPTGFEFTLKAWQLITHDASSPTYRRLRQPLSEAAAREVGGFRPTSEVWRAWEKTREIAAALGCRVVLFQCPASFKPTSSNKANLQGFFRRARQTSPDLAFVWEPRGWWPDEEIAALCQELGLVHGADPFARRTVTGGWFYFRLHGIGGYRHQHTAAQLSQLWEMTRPYRGGFCLFNNLSMRQDAASFLQLAAFTLR